MTDLNGKIMDLEGGTMNMERRNLVLACPDFRLKAERLGWLGEPKQEQAPDLFLVRILKDFPIFIQFTLIIIIHHTFTLKAPLQLLRRGGSDIKMSPDLG